MELIFKKAARADSEEILRLYKSLVGTEYCAWTENYPDREEITYDLSREALFCLKDGDKIIGVISMDDDPLVDALNCWTESRKPSVELSRIGVRADYQNRGIAGRMILRVSEEARRKGYQGIRMLVSKANVKALKAYNKLGFDVLGECHLYDEDWWCYEKSVEL